MRLIGYLRPRLPRRRKLHRLSFKSLFVIARNSSFSYKGKSPGIRQVGKELDVRYVLEGSVRKAGGKVHRAGAAGHAVNGLKAKRFRARRQDHDYKPLQQN
jgi:TolB-like protein